MAHLPGVSNNHPDQLGHNNLASLAPAATFLPTSTTMIGCRDHPRARRPVPGQMGQAPELCFSPDALTQNVLLSIEYDVEHRKPGIAQASEYLPR
jgi:hypothetical protein